MRTIPANVTDSATRLKLEAIGKQIAEKMNQIEALKVKLKSGKMGADVLSQLKQVSLEIESLDKQWKELAES
jgi:hypothetical protein